MEFVFSKMTLLIFGIIVTVALFGFLTVYNEIGQMQNLKSQGFLIKSTIDNMAASDFEHSSQIKFKAPLLISFNDTYFVLGRGGSTLRFGLAQSSGFVGMFNSSCLEVAKATYLEVGLCP